MLEDMPPNKNQDERLIHINWDPPRTCADVLKITDAGIYQVYGQHVVFGPASLLYIGRTVNFAERFQGHAAWLDFESDIEIRLGRLTWETDAERDKWLAHVEALTIYVHSPPYNSHHIAAYRRPPLRIRNHGQRGRLMFEYSGPWDVPLRPDDEKET